MPILKNPKHEHFAQAVAKGQSAGKAYVSAGYAKSDSSAHRVRINAKVSARIAEIQAKSAEKCGVTVDRIVQELAKIGFSDIRNALDWGMRTRTKKIRGVYTTERIQFVTLKDSVEVDDDTAAVVSEVWQTDQGIRFKFHDKAQALDKLGRHLGMFKDEDKTGATTVVINRVAFGKK